MGTESAKGICAFGGGESSFRMGDVVTVGSRPFVHGHVVVCMNSNLCFFVRRLGVCVHMHRGIIMCLFVCD